MSANDIRALENIFQPTLPARGATQAAAPRPSRPSISTHAPRTGSDKRLVALILLDGIISTHAPRTGSDMYDAIKAYPGKVFQPTLPARGATCRLIGTRPNTSNFNPRSPHGERRRFSSLSLSPMYISTHAPRTGSDRRRPRVPLGTQISTHAPRTGSDAVPPTRARSPF